MSNQDKEIERLRRLREQQLGWRDPMQGEMRRSKIAGQRPRAKFSLVDELAHMGAKLTWTLYGLVFGLVVGLWAGEVIKNAYGKNWTSAIVLFALLISGMAGFVMGRAKDSGKGDWPK